jgi:DHA1 family multidrug resistance protein-like MFS transporter
VSCLKQFLFCEQGPVLGTMLGFWLVLAGWRWIAWAFSIANFLNMLAVMLLMEETYAPYVAGPFIFNYGLHALNGLICSVIERKFQAKQEAEIATANPVSRKSGILSRFAMSADVRAVFARAFSRPPRLLFYNPVCALFSLYFGKSERETLWNW